MKTPTAPQSGAPVTANWGREVCDSLRRMRLQAGPGIRLSQTPEGTTIRLGGAAAQTHVVMPDEVVLVKVTGGSAASGYTVAVHTDGLDKPPTGIGVLHVPECAVDAVGDLPVGSVMIAHAIALTITGGGEGL